jgi:hypothetical protein
MLPQMIVLLGNNKPQSMSSWRSDDLARSAAEDKEPFETTNHLSV